MGHAGPHQKLQRPCLILPASDLSYCMAAVQGSFCLLFSPSDWVTALLCAPWHLVNLLPPHQGPQAAGMRAFANKWTSGGHWHSTCCRLRCSSCVLLPLHTCVDGVPLQGSQVRAQDTQGCLLQRQRALPLCVSAAFPQSAGRVLIRSH